jgi:hypothetical protein
MLLCLQAPRSVASSCSRCTCIAGCYNTETPVSIAYCSSCYGFRCSLSAGPKERGIWLLHVHCWLLQHGDTPALPLVLLAQRYFTFAAGCRPQGAQHAADHGARPLLHYMVSPALWCVLLQLIDTGALPLTLFCCLLAAGPKEHGIRLFTVHVRRGPPDVQDPGWNSLSKLNCISACIQVMQHRSVVLPELLLFRVLMRTAFGTPAGAASASSSASAPAYRCHAVN